ncbi:hypothetical protein Ahy_B07g088644 [Arachis hypogaea]|uniref:Uncharacterized protein n=1 Tax=Arachis hypogaea TaxID=3818 RepID=A0A444YF47_ARAHY|nr:hypothetical protein Ahy_B07g088644 [Arachis hypogaea]
MHTVLIELLDEDSTNPAKELGLLVSPGSNCTFAQDVAVMNTAEKHCCAIGEIRRRVIVTPDIDDMVENLTFIQLSESDLQSLTSPPLYLRRLV